MERQMRLAEINDEFGAARTNKKEFLEKMDRIIPWSNFISLIQPHYYKGERGNRPYELELMLRIFMLQNFYDLADMKVMNEILDSRAFSAFCCISSPEEVPDGDTIGRFRNLLIEHDLQKKERDPEAHSSKKGNIWHFGYKAHIEVDSESGLVHHVKTTATNEHDVTAVSDLMHGEEKTLHGDGGYLGADKREGAIVKNKSGKKIKYNINRRPSTIKKLSKSGQYSAKKKEHQKSSVRCKVEHVFAVVKRLFGYLKTRYRGLRKQTAKNYIMFAVANLYLADRKNLAV